jgi:hypothetical protein
MLKKLPLLTIKIILKKVKIKNHMIVTFSKREKVLLEEMILEKIQNLMQMELKKK